MRNCTAIWLIVLPDFANLAVLSFPLDAVSINKPCVEGDDNEAVFSWGRYLDATNAKAAPTKLFSTGIPDRPNPFRVGMKMEAIDPEHQAIFCCVTVAEIKGKY